MKPAHPSVKKTSRKLYILLAVAVCFSAGWSLHYINSQSNELYQQAELSIAKMQKKSHAITQMAHAMQNRSITLLKMLNQTDAFVKDGQHQLLFRHANIFKKNRDFLQAVELTEQQGKLLQELLELTGKNADIQMFVANLLLDDEKSRAAKTLFNTAVPNQIPMNEIITAFVALVDEETNLLLDELHVKQDGHQNIIIVLTIMLSSCVIFLFVTFINARKSNANE
ncbi:MAG: hypothetical protein COB22_02040 [Cycloclasticus sp.]|nr:MAG: hypothetical protein COB22_02040 [Cycloclasticus sp.]